MKIDARGKQCPLPVIEAKNALKDAPEGEIMEILVDNEIAVQNLLKMADHKGLTSSSTKTGEREYLVKIVAGASGEEALKKLEEETSLEPEKKDERRRGMVAVISADHMGEGDPVLGHLLLKGFLYALTQQEELPQTVLFYNGGAFLTTEGSESLEDLRFMEESGVEILTCGTCLNHYGLADKLAVGQVTNMYEIAERMTHASLIVKP